MTEQENNLAGYPSPQGHLVGAVYRHKKRRTLYELIGNGKMQTEHWRDPNLDAEYDSQAVDMREVTIYRSIGDGTLWVRPREEFEDGRFEALTTEGQP